MKLNVRVLVGCLCLILCSASPSLCKEWRGIVPLHSTRSDVIRLLGNPTHSSVTNAEYFDLSNEEVTIRWIDPTCQRRYPIEEDAIVHPENLVLSIKVFPKKPIPLPAEGVLINGGCSSNGWCYSFDNQLGYGFTTFVKGMTSFIYYPTAEEFKVWLQEHKTCQSSANSAT